MCGITFFHRYCKLPECSCSILLCQHYSRITLDQYSLQIWLHIDLFGTQFMKQNIQTDRFYSCSLTTFCLLKTTWALYSCKVSWLMATCSTLINYYRQGIVRIFCCWICIIIASLTKADIPNNFVNIELTLSHNE